MISYEFLSETILNLHNQFPTWRGQIWLINSLRLRHITNVDQRQKKLVAKEKPNCF